MSDQGSTYTILQGVPVMVSPLYTLPKKIFVAAELKMVIDDVTKLPAYPFAVERETIAHVEAARTQTAEAEEALAQKRKQYEEEKINKQKQAARKIAPGFLDTDTRILQPQQTYSTSNGEKDSNPNINDKTYGGNCIVTTSPKMLQPTTTSRGQNNKNSTKTDTAQGETSPEKSFDYHKFEQGLAPADPWDTPENDLAALQSILGSAETDDNSVKRTSTSPSPYPPPRYSQQQSPAQYAQQSQMPQPKHYSQKNEGVYWSIPQNANNSMTSPYPLQSTPHLPHPSHHLQQHTNSVPALPPKLFGRNSPTPTSSTSSPIVSPPAPPPSHNDYKSAVSSGNASPIPPPRPPLPTVQPALPHENLITELIHMGFTRIQAIDALEKNEYDLIRATNFLLDQA